MDTSSPSITSDNKRTKSVLTGGLMTSIFSVTCRGSPNGLGSLISRPVIHVKRYTDWKHS